MTASLGDVAPLLVILMLGLHLLWKRHANAADRQQWTRIEARLGHVGSGRAVLVRLALIEQQAEQLLTLAKQADIVMSDVEDRLADLEEARHDGCH